MHGHRRTLIVSLVLSAPLIAGLVFVTSSSGCGDDSGKSGGGDDASMRIDAALAIDADPGAPDARPPAADAAVATCTPAGGTSISLQTVVSSGLTRPVFMTSPPGDLRLFVVEQTGRIRILENDTLRTTPFLDIRAAVRDTGNEQGLLGLAFHPDYASNGRFFVNYTANGGGATVVAEYKVSADADVANAGSEIRLLTVPQPFTNHNGGDITFGPDGFLYIGMGDGGSGGDPQGNGQDNTALLGKMLRIDVNSATGAKPYGIPASNPFAGSSDGPNDNRPEIWATGLRNPWRYSFDRETDQLYIADVGQGAWEEVNVMPAASAGVNYGWNTKEGDACFEPRTNCDSTGLTDPHQVYSHGGNRCSITGGYVYRGGCFTDIKGWYFYADFCTGQVWASQWNGTTLGAPTEVIRNAGSPASFAEDIFGELYLLDLGGTISRIVAR